MFNSATRLNDIKDKGEVDYPKVLAALTDGPLNNGALVKATTLTGR